MKKKTFIILLGTICLVGAVVRSYKINNPIADWHSWRQVDTAAVARNYIKYGIDPLHPRYDDLSNIQSGKDNPQGWRMVEFPLYQIVAATLYRLVPIGSIEISLRIINIFASIGTIAIIGLLGRKFSSSLAGICAALFYAILPYSVFYGRTTLPEPFMVFLSLASIAFAVLSIRVQQQRKYGLLFLSAIFAALALLVKPFAIFLLIPLPYLFLLSLGITWVSLFVCIISFAISVVPLFLWREWITRFPEGIPVFTWLFNEGNIRFKGAWFHWLFAERLSKLILGYFGVVLFIVGIIRKKDHKEELFYLLLLIGGLAYIIIIARGNVQHDYYQIPLLPLISLYLGKGFEWFIRPPKDWTTSTSRVVGVIIVLFVLAFSWFEIRGFYWINHPEIVEAGKAANSLIPKDAKVIAPYNGDTSFLYQTNRQGWPIGFEIDKKISQGATFYVTVSPSDADGETKDLATRYTVVVRNDRFAIIDLTKPKILP